MQVWTGETESIPYSNACAMLHSSFTWSVDVKYIVCSRRPYLNLYSIKGLQCIKMQIFVKTLTGKTITLVWTQRYHWKCKTKNSRQRRDSTRPTTAYFCRQTIGRWTDIVRLQYSKRSNVALSAVLRGGIQISRVLSTPFVHTRAFQASICSQLWTVKKTFSI